MICLSLPALQIPIWTLVSVLLVPFLLYAEIHYRLPFWRGRYYQKLPEILFDAPLRIQTPQLPLLLLIKDAHCFPVHLEEVEVRLIDNSDRELAKHCFREELSITDKWFTTLYRIPVMEWRGQEIHIDACAIIKTPKKRIRVHTDQYRGLSHRPLQTFIDPDPLPLPREWRAGDLHCHSAWTEDQVEFGIPAASIAPLAESMGLHFAALLDHSYDLDDRLDSWTERDPELRKWHLSRETITELNHQNAPFLLLPGEEVSVDNGNGKTVHMGLLNHTRFVPGSGDSLEKGIRQPTEYYYAQILGNLEKTAMAFAAHPFTRVPFLQRLLVQRGSWNPHDNHPAVAAFQIVNGIPAEIEDGKKEWIARLLKGHKTRILAGNDAHGNFNRFRQVRLPLWKLHENQQQRFGEYMTYVHCPEPFSVEHLVRQLRFGESTVSNGPFLVIRVSDSEKRPTPQCATVQGLPERIHFEARSNSHFGALQTIHLFMGNLETGREGCFLRQNLRPSNYDHSATIPIGNPPVRGYFRAELNTDKGKIAYSNPVWFSQTKR